MSEMRIDRAMQLKIDAFARKRDYAADVLNKPALAWSYQIEIDKLIEQTAKPAKGE